MPDLFYGDHEPLQLRCFTLTQPWATLWAYRKKMIETRSWATSFRGVVLIHAAKGWPGFAKEVTIQRPFRSALGACGYEWDGHATHLDLPTGAFIGAGAIVGCEPTETLRHTISDREIEFGDYERGRFGFLTREQVVLQAPVPARGMLGLWTPTYEQRDAVIAQLPPGVTLESIWADAQRKAVVPA